MADSSYYEDTHGSLGSAISSPIPHNDLTEYGVLVALVGNEGKRWDELSVDLAEEDFFDPNYNLIFSEMSRLAGNVEKLTPYTVGIRISERLGVEHPAVRIAIGLEFEPSMSDPRELIKQLKIYTLRRRLISNLASATEKAYDLSEEHPGLIIDEVIQKVQDSAGEGLSADDLQEKAMPNLLGEIQEDLAYLKENKGEPRRFLKTGFDHLDDITWGGLRPNQLYVLAGRPGTGKTSFALNICENIMIDAAAKNKNNLPTIAFISLEQSASEIATKILCSMSEVPFGKFKRGLMSPSEELMVANACEDVEKFFSEFIVINPRGLNVKDFSYNVKQTKRAFGKLDLVVVDYIGLMQPVATSQYQTRAMEIAEITRTMKQLAIDEQIPILALAQVNRNPEGRSSTRPRLSDLRDSGAIEQDADFVMFLYKEEGGKVKPDYNKVELIVAKNRHGGVSNINLEFKESITVFTEHDTPIGPPPD